MLSRLSLLGLCVDSVGALTIMAEETGEILNAGGASDQLEAPAEFLENKVSGDGATTQTTLTTRTLYGNNKPIGKGMCACETFSGRYHPIKGHDSVDSTGKKVGEVWHGWDPSMSDAFMTCSKFCRDHDSLMGTEIKGFVAFKKNAATGQEASCQCKKLTVTGARIQDAEKHDGTWGEDHTKTSSSGTLWGCVIEEEETMEKCKADLDGDETTTPPTTTPPAGTPSTATEETTVAPPTPTVTILTTSAPIVLKPLPPKPEPTMPPEEPDVTTECSTTTPCMKEKRRKREAERKSKTTTTTTTEPPATCVDATTNVTNVTNDTGAAFGKQTFVAIVGTVLAAFALMQ